ncbi:MAG: hypothetical protein ACXWCV_16060 [Caldimonas sp.]
MAVATARPSSHNTRDRNAPVALPLRLLAAVFALAAWAAYDKLLMPTLRCNWVGRKLSQGLYRVRLGYVDTAALARVPENATVVFVMNHRSKLD